MNITVPKILGTLGVVLALLAAATDLFGSAALLLGLIGLAATAAGNVWTRYQGNLALTVIGVVVAVAGAVAPGLAGINSTYGRIAILVGAVFAAVGKGLFDTDVQSPPPT